ncbi:MAG: hypothetical protein AVDCRST_MAG64-1081, partial [uncultured Phycisphaerae bacterium]
ADQVGRRVRLGLVGLRLLGRRLGHLERGQRGPQEPGVVPGGGDRGGVGQPPVVGHVRPGQGGVHRLAGGGRGGPLLRHLGDRQQRALTDLRVGVFHHLARQQGGQPGLTPREHVDRGLADARRRVLQCAHRNCGRDV